MEKQEIRTFGRRHGKKLSQRKEYLIAHVLPQIAPTTNAKILEIGFGAGEHVRQLAQDNPDAIIIGAEPFINGVASLLSAMTDEKDNAILPEYKNIRIFADDVRIMLKNSAFKFNEIWILHPDPWPKAKHEKRRLLNAEFLTLLSRHLEKDGKIIIGTDHWEYYEWITERVPETPLRIFATNLETIKTRYQSKNMAGTDAPKYLILQNG